MSACTTSSGAFSAFHGQWRELSPRSRSCHGHHIVRPIVLVPCALLRGTPKKSKNSEPKLEMVIDLDDMRSRAATSLDKFSYSTRGKIRRFLASGSEALLDLQSLVTVDRHGRIIVACRPSTLYFLGNLLVMSCGLFFIFRFFVELWVQSGLGLRAWELVRRRDRSLGGKEVVVGKRFRRNNHFTTRSSQLDFGATKLRVPENMPKKRPWERKDLPEWWPNSFRSSVSTVGSEELRREANRLIRAIMDNRMSGKDFAEDDIIQLRHMCKISGAKVSFDTSNTRDSFFRASVDFILDFCSKFQPALALIEGEEPRQFIAGLADNIGMETTRAATIVCAAVAARSRSGFLQAWAFEIQGKRSEALDQLQKLYNIHQTFPPEINSPEMEMVSHGLEKHLKVEQRKHLYELFKGVSGVKSQRSIEEALGLTVSPAAPHKDVPDDAVTGGYV